MDHLLAENHLIMAEHTTRHWPQELWLTGATFDRTNRETGEERTERDLVDRANAEVDRRLAAYQPVETDPALDAALREIVQGGMGGAELPELPPPGVPTSGEGPTRRRNRRRG